MNATAGGEAEGKGGGIGVELLKILRAKSRDVTLSATLNTEIPFARTILPYKRLRGSILPTSEFTVLCQLMQEINERIITLLRLAR